MCNESPDCDVVVDFDRTIFDTEGLETDLYQICHRHGISPGILRKKQTKVESELPVFNFFDMVLNSELLKKRKLKILIAELESFLQENSSNYIFADVFPFLEKLKAKGLKIAVFTFGDVTFQMAKYLASGLAKYTDMVSVTDSEKCENRQMFENPGTIFIDDRSDHIDSVKKRFPHVQSIHVMRPGSKYTEPAKLADRVVHSLDIEL